MMMHRRSAIAMLGLAAACPWAFANQASASAALRLIISQDAGGGTDINARLMAQHLAKHLEGSISVENDARAGGVTALQSALSSPPITASILESTIVFNSAIEDQYPIQLSDIALLDNFLIATRVLAVNVATGIKSVADWRASGKTLRLGTRSETFYVALEMRLLSKLWGVDVTIVPGYSTIEARAAFAAGEVDLLLGSYTSVKKLTKDDSAIIIARSTDAAGEGEETKSIPSAMDYIVDDTLVGLIPVVNKINKRQLAFATSTAALSDTAPLSAAFSATKVDPEYKAATAAAGLVIDTRSSDEVRAEFSELIADFDNIRTQMRKLL
jgi:tripartite-type tricarboxylate transporter receptor subunit TctC